MGKRTIHWKLPKGSLNTPDRGNTEERIRTSGYDIIRYRAGENSYRPQILNDEGIECSVGRPQTMPRELYEGKCDLIIVGNDWAREWGLRGFQTVPLVEDLGYGKVEVIAAVPEEQLRELGMDWEEFVRGNMRYNRARGKEPLGEFIRKWLAARGDEGDPLKWYTEYPSMAQHTLGTNPVYVKLFGEDHFPIVDMDAVGEAGTNRVIHVINYHGETESVEAPIVDNTQTGGTLRDKHQVVVAEIMDSAAGMYTTEDVLGDKWKRGKVEEIATVLKGAAKGSGNRVVKFNCLDSHRDPIARYLIERKWCADAPTIASLYSGNNSAESRTGRSSVEVVIRESEWPHFIAGLRRQFSGTDDGGEPIISNIISSRLNSLVSEL